MHAAAGCDIHNFLSPTSYKALPTNRFRSQASWANCDCDNAERAIVAELASAKKPRWCKEGLT